MHAHCKWAVTRNGIVESSQAHSSVSDTNCVLHSGSIRPTQAHASLPSFLSAGAKIFVQTSSKGAFPKQTHFHTFTLSLSHFRSVLLHSFITNNGATPQRCKVQSKSYCKSFIHSFIQRLTHSQSLTHSLTDSHSLTQSHSLTHSRPPAAHSLTVSQRRTK